jgi:hypothetical protein
MPALYLCGLLLRLHLKTASIKKGAFMNKRASMSKRTQNIAIGGICLAGSVLSVFIASIVPGAELTLYAVSSIFVAVLIIEAGLRGGWMMYGGTILLCLILIPNKLALIPYVFFFGLYGIIKYFAEQRRQPVVQLAMKAFVFLVVFGIGYLFFREIFFGNIQLPDFPVPILVLVGLAFLFLYDFIFTQLIQLYRKRIRRTEKEFSLGKDL